MPQAAAAWLAGALFASGTAFGTAAAIFVANYGAAVIIGGYLAYNVASAKRQQRKARDAANAAYEASLVDRKSVIRSPVMPRNIVLGRDRASGMIPCWFTWGDQRQYHTFAVTLAGHECDAVESFYFNGELVTIDGNGWVTTAKYCKKEVVSFSEVVTFDGSGNATATYTPVGTQGVSAKVLTFVEGFDQWDGLTWSGTTLNSTTVASTSANVQYSHEVVTPLFRIWTYLGAAGQAASAELIAAASAAGTPTAWDSNRKGTSVCYCVVQMEADFDVLGQIGVPNVSAVVRGVKAYDTRTATTAWTQNPAVLARWFLVESIYSPTTLSAEVGEDELEASANVADEVIDIGPGLNAARYTCNGQLTTDASPLDNLNHILDAMDGEAVYVSGAFQVVGGYHKTPVLTIDESACSDQDIRISPATTKDRLFNTVVGTFVDATKDYVRTSYPMMTVAAYVTEDNGETLPQTMDFELVNDPRRCQMIAWQRLTRARQALAISFGTNLKGYDTWPLENVYLSFKEFFGDTPKEFSIRRREFAGGTLSYVAQETGAEVWDWDYTDAGTPVDLPNTSLPDPFTLTAPTITAVASGDAELLIGQDGTIVSRIKVTIAATDDIYVLNGGAIVTRYAPTGTEEWQSGPAVDGNEVEFCLSPVEDGVSYTMQARYRNSAGRLSAWSPTWMHTVIGKLEPPPAVTGVTLSTDRVFFNELTKAEVKDLAGYLVRVVPGTVAQWSLGTPMHVGIITDSPWLLPLALYGVQTVMVASIDTSGNVSALGVDSSATQDYGSPNTTNAIQQYDFGANGWPGFITDGTAGATIEADLDPAADFWSIGADFWVRDNAADFWGGATYLPLVYITRFVPMYGGGQILLELEATGSRISIEYRIDGATLGDFWEGNGGAGGVTDFWSGDAFWGENVWQPWLGSAISARDQGIQWRVSIDGGPQQGVISEMIASLVLQLVSQIFGSQNFDAGGTRLDPALGIPVRNWVSVSAATPTPDGAIAVTGRVADYDPNLGPLIYLLDETGAPVTDTGNAIVFGFEDATT